MHPDLKRFLRSHFFSTKSRLHGSAAYMGFWEKLFFLWPKHTGFIVGRTRWGWRQQLSQQESEKNLLLVAPTGMFKTTSFIIENILCCTGSVVATDPSGEIYSKTSGAMKRRGYDILIFNPTDLERSVHINFLQAFPQDHQSIKQIATILAKHNSSKNDHFWVTQATGIIYIVISALVSQQNNRYVNLANVRWVLNHFGVQDKAVGQLMKTHLSQTLFAEYQAFLKQDSRVLMNTLSTARAALDLWSDPQIADLTSDNTIDLNAFRKRKTILYLIVPEHRVSYFSLILNLTFSALFQACIENAETRWGPENRKGKSVYFFMDEFTNACGEIQHFANIVTVSRKRRMPIAMIIQDLAQLSATYGHETAQTIYGGGCGNKLFYGGLDIKACRRIEETIGTKTQISIEQGGERKVAVPLLRSASLRQLFEDEYLLINTNNPPIKGKKQPHFKNKKLRRLTQRAPFPFMNSKSPTQTDYLDMAHFSKQPTT